MPTKIEKDPVVTSGHQQTSTKVEEVSESRLERNERLQKEAAASIAAAEAPATETSGALVEAKAPGAVVEGFFAPQEMEDLSGYGQENVTSANTLLPRLAILQLLSPQVNKKKIEFIPGAEVGDFCELGTGEIFKGEVELIPVHFVTQYIQWKKNRGGFAGNLGMDAACLKDTALNEKRQNILPNGDSIVETATWFALLRVGFDWRRIFLPFSVSGLKVSKKWMTLIRAEKLLGPRGLFMPPLFYRPWTMTVGTESNDQGDWFLPIPARTARDPALITPEQPDAFKTIYHCMAEMNDKTKWLLEEAKKFYADARDNLVVGDMSRGDDPNDGSNSGHGERARLVGSGTGVDDKNTRM